MSLFLCAIAATCALVASADEAPKNLGHMRFQWTDCGRQDRLAKFDKFTLEPTPFLMTRLSKYTTSIEGEILKDLTANATIHIRVERIQRVLGRELHIPIPCVQKVFGSCSINFIEYLEHPKIVKAFCALVEAAGKPCSSPMKAGKYLINELPLVFNLEHVRLHPIVQRFGSGNYGVTVRIKEGDSEIACVNVKTYAKIQLENFDDYHKDKDGGVSN